MHTDTGQSRESCGPPVYENWLAAQAGQPSRGIEEYELYTDAHITGEITDGYGPYQFLNLVPFPMQNSHARATIVLRLGMHIEDALDHHDMTRTDAGQYHGGTLVDEIAALASLAMGIRLKAGGLTRTFDPAGDPLGRPRKFGNLGNPQPVLLTGSYGHILPCATGRHPLADLVPMSTVPSLSPSDAVALVRSARLFQDALWIAESEPSLSWVMLVSAVETASSHWRKATDNTPLERLKAAKPDLVELLESTGIESLTENVADHIAETMQSTKKFLDFVSHFMPPPPEKRPVEWAQHSWKPGSLKKTMRLIYGYRSKALHDGRPFPAPMCNSPFRLEDWNALAEKPLGDATSTMGGTWLARDAPMLLNTFEYIVRNALLAWWGSMTAA